MAWKDHKKVITYILIMTLLGVFLVVWSNTNLMSPAQVSKPLERREEVVVVDLEERLKKSLSLMEGVGRVEVQIYYSSNPRYVFGEDRSLQEKATLEEESSSIKQIREESTVYEVVILRDGAGGERPLIEEEVKPHITGVLIVAEGAGRAVVRDRILRSVATLLGLPLYRIDVVTGKGGS